MLYTTYSIYRDLGDGLLFYPHYITGWWFGPFFIFPFSLECHHPNWRSHIFQRGRYTTNQIVFYVSFFFFLKAFPDMFIPKIYGISRLDTSDTHPKNLLRLGDLALFFTSDPSGCPDDSMLRCSGRMRSPSSSRPPRFWWPKMMNMSTDIGCFGCVYTYI